LGGLGRPFNEVLIMQIKYIKHPVSVEEKRSLNKQGFKLIDTMFKPVEEAEEFKPAIKAQPKRKAK
jgi:hypothetical protein